MSKSRNFFACMVALLLLFFTWSCSQSQEAPKGEAKETASEATVSDADAAAIVNGTSIPMTDLEVAVRNVVIQNGMDPGHLEAFMGQFGPRILDQLIDGELLYQAAVKGGYVAAQEDVDASFADLSGRYEDAAEFEAAMEERGFTEASLKSNIRKQLSIQKFIQETIVPQAVVPEETVREAYDQNPQNFTSQEQVKASHILIKSAESDPQEKRDEALKKAEGIAAQARAEGADFGDLARQYSEGPSGPSGGDLGYFTRGRMVKPFEDAAFSMGVNEVSDPILTQFGYHIIKVTDKKEESTSSFEEVKEELGQDLQNRMVNELIGQKLEELKGEADIQVLFTPEPQEAPQAEPQGNPEK